MSNDGLAASRTATLLRGGDTLLVHIVLLKGQRKKNPIRLKQIRFSNYHQQQKEKKKKTEEEPYLEVTEERIQLILGAGPLDLVGFGVGRVRRRRCRARDWLRVAVGSALPGSPTNKTADVVSGHLFFPSNQEK